VLLDTTRKLVEDEDEIESDDNDHVRHSSGTN
jgi:hypothetical protein